MPSNHLSAPELYQACLDACIDDIENFPVDRRSGVALPLSRPKRHTDSSTVIEIALTTSTCFSTRSLLPSPPPSPSRTGRKQASLLPPSPTLAAMQSSRYADTPIRSKEPPSQHLLDEPLRAPLSALPPMTSASVSQDARSKLAVPSAPNAGKAKPKKSTVKIVGLVEHVPATPPKSAACTPLAPTTPTPKTALSQKENVKSTDEEESLEALFARLTSKAPATPIRSSTNISVSQLGKQTVSLESQLGAPRVDPPETTELAKVAAKHATPDETDQTNPSENREEYLGNRDLELETKYMRKASAYVDALSDTKLGTARSIGVVSKKLHKTYAQDKKIGQDDVDAIKARFAFAITTYLNKVLDKGPKACTTDFIKQTLQEVQGDFLKLCAKLVEDRYISLDNLDDVAGLAKAMLNIIPIGEPGSQTITVANATPQKEPPRSPTTPETMKNPKAAMENVGAWPSQEKRETPPAHRTCILKGVAAVTSIHQLQALVWGGRLESISMPEPGSSNALVKFLTAEACERYHKNTANGIVIKGDMKDAVVFVELTEGPNSANDVIQSCIEGGVSRCVRAIGEVELNDQQLTKLAQGKDQVKKREVDCIKRGKNTRGHEYAEFRFANIYNALSFRREITNDDDWEHCNIGYAPDPCEVATGLHYDD